MKRRGSIFWLAIFVLAVSAHARHVQETNLIKDVVYGHADGIDLKLDLAQPAMREGPLPALVFIHGGGWQMGTKNDFEPVIRQFASEGYVTVSVGYRLAPKHPWPAQIEDVKCAVRFLRAHADDYGVDPDAIGAIGHSAGAHLALLLGLMNPEDGFEDSGGHAGVSSKVQAVINVCGPTDLRVWRASTEAHAEARAATGKDFEDVLMDFVGTTDRDAPVIAQVSPVAYIDADAPPIITFHGGKDPVVPVEQATLLHEALEQAGARNHKLVIIEDADHAFGNLQHLTRILVEGRQFVETWLKELQSADGAVKTQTE